MKYGIMNSKTDPCFNVEWIDAAKLKPNTWNPNRVLKAEYDILVKNIETLGWVQPVIANKDYTIIDGFHRCRIAQDIKSIADKYNKQVPVVFIEVTEPEAMIFTIRMNRAKGVHASNGMQSIAKKLVNEFGFSKKQLRLELGMSSTEVDLLLSDSVLKARNSKNWKYNNAWYPIDDGAKYGKTTK